ncbi:MAG: hypothetical protein M1434_00300 [Chloroflexi bacterium]|nr:hypothetical protein [Chloroflexota bacterium]MCL5273175.1 hypothetical protein [Chloroflexota bacterium]
MESNQMKPDVSGEDIAEIGLLSWLTHRRLLLFVIGWLVLFTIGSFFISNPFQSEPNASAEPNYAFVMYMHGLLIGMVGLIALLSCEILGVRSQHTRQWVVGGVLFATITAGVGGIWNRTIPGSEVPMWTQILGFFALDEILIALLIGLIGEWRSHRSLPLLASGLAVISMFGAALMGHLAGWIEEFGWEFPPVIAMYAHGVGFDKQADFTSALVGSHSHEMAVAAMALIMILVAQQFGYHAFSGAARRVSQVGLSMIAVGTALMTVMYVVMGLTTWSPPTLFASGPDLVNGIAGDDAVTGILVMFGGVVVIVGLVMGRLGLTTPSFLRPIRLAAVWAWVLSFATVAVVGYAIAMNEAYFGAGDAKAAGAAQDAVFTWFHQDIGLFLLPTIIAVMLVVERLHLVNRASSLWFGGAIVGGTTMVFLGGLIWVFLNPALFGPGYVVATVGLIVVGIVLLAILWRGVFSQSRLPTAALRVSDGDARQ